MITLKNTSTANVVVSAPDINFRREMTPSRTVKISDEEYTDLSFDPGFQALVKSGFITVGGIAKDDEKAELIDTAEVGETSTREEVKKLFQEKNYKQFGKLIKNCSHATKDIITEVAVEEKVTDTTVVRLIKQYCNDFDVINAINCAHQMEG